mgnify:CR=1 FL=1
MTNKLKDTKTLCECGCRNRLYIGDFDDGQVYIAIGEKGKYRMLPEVIIDRKKLLALLK